MELMVIGLPSDCDVNMEDTTKKCSTCGSSENGFYKGENRCKKCVKERVAKWQKDNPEKSYINQRNSYDRCLYGLPKGAREKMIEEQNGQCAICGNIPTTRRGLHIDHDHETGKVRGLLCHGCNTAIGSLGDDIELLRKAIMYLEKFGL